MEEDKLIRHLKNRLLDVSPSATQFVQVLTALGRRSRDTGDDVTRDKAATLAEAVAEQFVQIARSIRVPGAEIGIPSPIDEIIISVSLYPQQ